MRSRSHGSRSHGDRFRNRRDAGQVLAASLGEYRDRGDVVVLGIARGGVPVAFEVAGVLHARLIVRKLGVPGHEELAFGAIAPNQQTVLDDGLIGALGITPEQIRQVIDDETAELRRREQKYRGGLEPAEWADATAIVVDDGLATGNTMRAAVRAVRSAGPRAIIVAVPVAPAATCRELRSEAEAVVCPWTPTPFGAVGAFYRDFGQTGDDEVRRLLAER